MKFRNYISENTVNESSKNITLDIDFVGDGSDVKSLEKKYKVKIKITGDTTADVTGNKKNIINMLTGDYGMDTDDVKDIYSELFESEEVNENHFKKGQKVKIKNAKSYDSLAKSSEVDGVISGQSMTVRGYEYYPVKVGTGSYNVEAKDIVLNEEVNEALGPEQCMKELGDLQAMLKDLNDMKDDLMELPNSTKKSLANHAYAISKILMKV